MSSRRSTPKQREHWLAQFEQSSLSATAFCREHQLSYQSFLNWRRKDQPNEADIPTEFIEVEVPAPTATPSRHNSIVELTFPGELLLHIHQIMIRTHSVKVCSKLHLKPEALEAYLRKVIELLPENWAAAQKNQVDQQQAVA